MNTEKIRIKKHNRQCASIVPIVRGSSDYCDCDPVVEWIGTDDPRADIAKLLGKKKKKS